MQMLLTRKTTVVTTGNSSRGLFPVNALQLDDWTYPCRIIAGRPIGKRKVGVAFGRGLQVISWSCKMRELGASRQIVTAAYL